MSRFSASVSRRLMLGGLASLPLAAALRGLPAAAAVRPDADAALVAISDLHSCYGALPALVRAVKDVRASLRGRPMAILVNGDVFDRSDAVALRSAGMVDWAAMGVLASIAPVVLNIGDQEVALRDDLATVVAGAHRIGVTVVGNVVDKRTGDFFAPISTRLELGGNTVGILGLSPQDPDLWRAGARDAIATLDPVGFAGSAGYAAFAGVDMPLVLSHAGLAADKKIFPALPPGAVLVGGHDHLDFQHHDGDRLMVHPGCYGESLSVISLKFGAAPSASAERVEIRPGGDEDMAVSALVDSARLAYLSGPAQEAIAELPEARTRAEGALLAADALRSASGADLALIDHVGLGSALPGGTLRRYDLDKFMRRDAPVVTAEVSGEALGRILARANQHEAQGLEGRTGDFVHAPVIAPDPAATYRLAMGEWVAARSAEYLAAPGLSFAPTEGLTLRGAVEARLRSA
ncbi:metallophosphoesterase [Rhodovulum sp. DZ06]|uniref:metallophosphoesterase n=1 Tax=Rhodovulum sp. DZ06 TaxID=3425126 RepID=UPI003D3273D9